MLMFDKERDLLETDTARAESWDTTEEEYFAKT
jgi:hypothetical protein